MRFLAPIPASVRWPNRSGFSLVELLIVIMILGIMGSLALVAFGNHNDTYKRVRDQRNAQELVTEFVAAQVAGVDFVIAGDKLATLAKVAEGGVATEGSFKGRRYGLPNVSERERNSAAEYVSQRPDGWLVYASEGGAP